MRDEADHSKTVTFQGDEYYQSRLSQSSPCDTRFDKAGIPSVRGAALARASRNLRLLKGGRVESGLRAKRETLLEHFEERPILATSKNARTKIFCARSNDRDVQVSLVLARHCGTLS